MTPNEQEVRDKFLELCADLNMDGNATDEAWQSFLKISNTYTLEGDALHWLACALYVACRTCAVPTVKGSLVEGNYVSLTRLLRSCKFSLVQFFSKMKKWADMANLPKEMRDKVDRLERSFNVSTVIFKKFEPIFCDIFKDPFKDPPRPARSRKQRRIPCTSSEVFAFCWTLFIRVKGHFPAISEDLVNSFHLLLCCVDLMYSNALLAQKKDILNPNFIGLPPGFDTKEFEVPSEPPCIIDLLCNKHQGIAVEAKGIKEHWWKPYLKKLMEKKIIKGKIDLLTGLLDTNNFEPNSKAINKEYEEHVLNVGDFDERIFLGENASEEIGTPAKGYLHPGISELAEKMKEMKGNLQQYIQETKSLLPSTPLTGRKYLKDKDAAYITPVSTATQGVSRLQKLLLGREASPNDALRSIFQECSANPEEKIVNRVKEMGETFCTCYAMPSEDHIGSHTEFAKKRLSLGENLYYKALEDIMVLEQKRLPPKTDFSNMLDLDAFHRSLFACCLEIVIFSYNSQRSFPWVLQIFNLQPYYFYKVIELLIRAEDGLSRDVVKHLNHIEEQILESMAWKTESPLWTAIETSGLNVPSCEDVSLPHPPNSNFHHSSQLVSSPLAHPAVRRVTNERKNPQSPVGLSERFQSPAPAAMSSARRRLFATTSASSTGQLTLSTTQTVVDNISGAETTIINNSPIMNPGRNVTIILQQVQSDNGITYLPAQITRSPLTQGNQQVTCVKAAVTSDNTGNSSVPSSVVVTAPITTQAKTASETMVKPKRTGSLALFFRKVYHLAGVRLKELCDRLLIMDEELRRKIWTCFEYSIMKHTELMCDRHLDQLLMCAVYVICKVTKEDRSFQEIMKHYRLQPQAASHVYRSVLLASKGNKKRRNSGSSETSKDGSGSNSPVPSENSKSENTDKEEKESKRTEQLSTIRSSSTLPVPHPGSQPPTPTKLTGTGTHFEFEERGDLIKFYNKVYVPKLQKFAYKFSQTNNGLESPPLSPLPRLNAHPSSPWRRVSNKHSLYIAPLVNTQFPPSPGKPLSCCFNKSPAKDLRAINNFVKLGDKKVVKRLLQDDNDSENPPKRLCEDLTLRKIQDVITERQGGNNSNGLPE
ncbi:retinoblastoma-like protein 1 [Trichonephila inaurata madagascariensis]|uniref:Retinoblastoma-like protein 1 n=1 Tax=Trichonephila inaurata madagascariensis TaxID=2747483 RepID=A0A8X7CQE8_9ARAC|nr:retinoblastoma-like protein 1 [Trichonephila inaurata madagascariensis]